MCVSACVTPLHPQVSAVLEDPRCLGPRHLGPHLLARLPPAGLLAPEVAALIGDCLQPEPSERPTMRQVVARMEGMAVQALPRPPV